LIRLKAKTEGREHHCAVMLWQSGHSCQGPLMRDAAERGQCG
jgi:hypothetical protein